MFVFVVVVDQTETITEVTHSRRHGRDGSRSRAAAIVTRGPGMTRKTGIKENLIWRRGTDSANRKLSCFCSICKEMADPCSFSDPSQCTCTHISWFVNVLFEKQILDCRAELDFEVKENGVKTLVRIENFCGSTPFLLCARLVHVLEEV